MVKSWRHQRAAVRKVNKAFETLPKCQAQLCCGSGKTRIQHMLIESRPNDRFSMVLFPTIELILQTLLDWESLGTAGYDEVIIVCSEDIQKDLIDYQGLNISRVTTDVSTIREFAIKERHKRKLVLATYQSGSNISVALWGRRVVDLLIYDEAHVTSTGFVDNLFALTLHNDNIHAKKRLFLTATRRIGEESQINQIVMNNERLFGPLVYQYSFKKAIKDGIVKDFKVHVGVITSEVINNLESYQYDAGITLLEKVLEQYDLKKGMCFHRTIEDAKYFAGKINSDSELLGLHINGSQSRSEKRLTMKRFQSSQNTIITSARYLVQGVDVPDNDLVAFMSKKESAIDVSQAIGRLCRRKGASDTKDGVVLIPIFISAGNSKESFDKEIEKGFAKLWNLIEGLNNIDDFFTGWVAKAKKLREEGDTTKLAKHLAKKINFSCSGLDIASLNKFVSTAMASSNKIDNEWLYKFRELKKYKKKHGSTLVKRESNTEKVLANWCNKQRKSLKDGRLSLDKIKMMDELGFMWCPLESRWQSRFLELDVFFKKNGHTNLPSNEKAMLPLCKWLYEQKKMARKNSLLTHREVALKAIVDDFTPEDTRWNQQFNAAKKHYLKNKTLTVPPKSRLGVWLYKQVLRVRKGTMPKNRLDQLTTINFESYLKAYIQESKAA